MEARLAHLEQALDYIQSQGADEETIQDFMKVFDVWVEAGEYWEEALGETSPVAELFEEFLEDELQI